MLNNAVLYYTALYHTVIYLAHFVSITTTTSHPPSFSPPTLTPSPPTPTPSSPSRCHIFDLCLSTQEECSSSRIYMGDGIHDWITRIQVLYVLYVLVNE